LFFGWFLLFEIYPLSSPRLNHGKAIHRPDKRDKAMPFGFGHFLFAKQNDIQPCTNCRDSMVVRQNLTGVPDLSERLRAEANINLQ
jgi:hypothetical protein